MADTGLRGKVEDYKAYIRSLLFFKRLSDDDEWETQQRVSEFKVMVSWQTRVCALSAVAQSGRAGCNHAALGLA